MAPLTHDLTQAAGHPDERQRRHDPEAVRIDVCGLVQQILVARIGYPERWGAIALESFHIIAHHRRRRGVGPAAGGGCLPNNVFSCGNDTIASGPLRMGKMQP
ncbi:hypothetical protein GCM10017566_66390 [Amycolatopsis bartoniae]|uniref:Uncharacterized protein n=1 Tax=Amycolatopsis bartoniae TaxID=941986 RepID=A0A8H9MDY2_9PSEU|nr:hypothetical protein GCM10017566_66390 [Amycolatopsis bartoniae]